MVSFFLVVKTEFLGLALVVVGIGLVGVLDWVEPVNWLEASLATASGARCAQALRELPLALYWRAGIGSWWAEVMLQGSDRRQTWQLA